MKIVAALDEQKVDSLLGKTLNGNIVRKRLTTIELKNDEYKISMTTEANLANSEESIYDTNSKTTKSWSLNGMESFFYECPTNNTPLPLTDLEIYFREDALEFESKTSANVPNHIVLLLTHINTAHEIHVDKRTGLTYEIDNK
ncbi:hypothetical protein H6768_05890 [Candidatus Peribacteria bacterium]|nr:hypothetical protein [Candidatus Peribacteria bacterium]